MYCSGVTPLHRDENKFSLYFIKYLLSTYYIKIFQSKFVYCNEIRMLHNVPVTFFDNTDKFCWNSVYMGTVLNWYAPK